MAFDLDSPESRAFMLNLASIAMMSAAPVLTKLAVSTLPPVVASMLSYMIVSATLLLLATVRGSLGGSVRLLRSGPLLWFGVVAAAASALLYQGIAWSGPVTGGLLIQLSVPFGVLFAVVMLGERLPRRAVAALLLVLAGFAIFLLANGRSIEGDSSLGAWTVTAAAALFAYSTVLSKPLSVRHGAVTVMTSSSIVSATGLMVVAMTQLDVPTALQRADSDSLLAVAGTALIGSLGGKFLFYRAIATGPVTSANVVRSLGPLLVALYSIPLGLADLTWIQWLGGAVLVTGLVLFARATRTPAAKALPATSEPLRPPAVTQA